MKTITNFEKWKSELKPGCFIIALLRYGCDKCPVPDRYCLNQSIKTCEETFLKWAESSAEDEK